MVQDVLPSHSFSYGNTTFNVMNVNKGEGISKHEHTFNHIIICLKGSCKITKENIMKTIDKNSGAINLKENEWHEIEANEDDTVFVNIMPNPNLQGA